jgi:hypothetical protein
VISLGTMRRGEIGFRVPDAVQRAALAERCTADPGPFQARFA